MTKSPHTIVLPDELWSAAQTEAKRRSLDRNTNISTTSVMVTSLTQTLLQSGWTMNEAGRLVQPQMTFTAAAPTHREAPMTPDIRNSK